MAELADALDSGSNEVKLVQVQVLLSAPYKNLVATMIFESYRFLFLRNYMCVLTFSLVLPLLCPNFFVG